MWLPIAVWCFIMLSHDLEESEVEQTGPSAYQPQDSENKSLEADSISNQRKQR